jgi:hypothetical protein
MPSAFALLTVTSVLALCSVCHATLDLVLLGASMNSVGSVMCALCHRSINVTQHALCVAAFAQAIDVWMEARAASTSKLPAHSAVKTRGLFSCRSVDGIEAENVGDVFNDLFMLRFARLCSAC